MLPTILKQAALLAAEEVLAWYQRKQAKAAAQEKYAKTPAPIRGCPKCKEIAYSPGQTNCYKCGSLL